MAPLRFPIPTSAGDGPSQGQFPKNMTITFGTHRASVYGTTTAATTTTLTTTVNDQVRESHAREFTSRQVRPKILDEEFQENQKLLNNVEVEPPLFTLTGPPHSRSSPRPLKAETRLRPARGRRRRGDGGIWKWYAPRPAFAAPRSRGGTISSSPYHARCKCNHLSRGNHGRLSGGPFPPGRNPNSGRPRYRHVGPLYGGPSPLCGTTPVVQELQPGGFCLYLVDLGASRAAPPTHTFDGNLARGSVFAMLQMEYPTPDYATRDAHALANLVAEAIKIETFVLYTVVTKHRQWQSIHQHPNTDQSTPKHNNTPNPTTQSKMEPTKLRLYGRLTSQRKPYA
jgi:hypothetical protein